MDEFFDLRLRGRGNVQERPTRFQLGTVHSGYGVTNNGCDGMTHGRFAIKFCQLAPCIHVSTRRYPACGTEGLPTVRWHIRVDLEEVLNELVTE